VILCMRVRVSFSKLGTLIEMEPAIETTLSPIVHVQLHISV
jgi:hypothetical protein